MVADTSRFASASTAQSPLTGDDYSASVAEIVREAEQVGQPDVVVIQSKKAPAARYVRRRRGRLVDQIEVNTHRIISPNAAERDSSRLVLARAVASRARDGVRTLLFSVGSVILFASGVAAVALLLLTGDRTAALPGIGSCCLAIALFHLAGLRSDIVADKFAAELLGVNEVIAWLEQQPGWLDVQVRIRRLGGSPRRRRAVDPVPRPRQELSWSTTLGAIALVWVLLFLHPSVKAVGSLLFGTPGPDDTSTVSGSLEIASRLVASAVLAVSIWVVIRKWRHLTWTQVGVPYQRALRGIRGKSKLNRRRRTMTAFVFFSFFAAAVVAGLSPGVVGGVDPGNDIMVDNQLVAAGQCIRAGIFEELGFVAIPAALVLYRTRVDRPTGKPWMYALLIAGSGVARAIPHVYYGPGALIWAFTWGSLVMAAYLRWRRILPLIAAHITLDLLVTLSPQLT